MRRIIKVDTSLLKENDLKYIEGNSNNNLKISKILYSKQKGFCAYTEEFIGRADAKDIEHFNPTLKNTAEDSFTNWSLVKHQWNIEKSNKWNKHQPVLLPTDPSFEERIVYDNGDYRVSDSNDVEAINLIKLLKLDDIILADQRKKYIKRKTSEIEKFGVSAVDFFQILIHDDINQISYIRAIQEEFQINIWDTIPQPK
jgi:hypothetical protein